MGKRKSLALELIPGHQINGSIAVLTKLSWSAIKLMHDMELISIEF
jgi:hypothetical protein